jgi:hypothetical protein
MIENPRTSVVLMVVVIVLSAIGIAFVLTSFAHGSELGRPADDSAKVTYTAERNGIGGSVASTRKGRAYASRRGDPDAGDAEINHELLRLAASLEDEARALEIAQPHALGGSEDAEPQLSKRARALLTGQVLPAEPRERPKG